MQLDWFSMAAFSYYIRCTHYTVEGLEGLLAWPNQDMLLKNSLGIRITRTPGRFGDREGWTASVASVCVDLPLQVAFCGFDTQGNDPNGQETRLKTHLPRTRLSPDA